MKIEKVSFNYNSEKLRGIRVHAPDVYENLEAHLVESMERIYNKHVPRSTRTYIEAVLASEENTPTKGGSK